MAVSKTLALLFAVVAVVVADEAAKDKRDVLLGALPYAGVPYGSPVVAPGYVAAPAAVPYVSRPAAYAISPAGYVSPYYAPGPAVAYTGVPAYDDGKYYPGKYERPTFYNVPRVVV